MIAVLYQHSNTPYSISSKLQNQDIQSYLEEKNVIMKNGQLILSCHFDATTNLFLVPIHNPSTPSLLNTVKIVLTNITCNIAVLTFPLKKLSWAICITVSHKLYTRTPSQLLHSKIQFSNGHDSNLIWSHTKLKTPQTQLKVKCARKNKEHNLQNSQSSQTA